MSTINKNLIVVEEFDNFAEAVDKLDFSQEDLVSLVTSLSKVFYWLNVESVWGLLGFTWDSLNAEKLGYGHFNTTTIPFTIIPKLPDGERILLFNSTLNNINIDSDSVLEIRRSNWENLHTLLDFHTGNVVNITADFTGANITKLQYLFKAGPLDHLRNLYIKGDFSNASGIVGPNTGGYLNDPMIARRYNLIVDEENKYLNLPANDTAYGITLLYEGEGPLKLEYFFRELELKQNAFMGNTLQIVSASHQYYITLNEKLCTTEHKLRLVNTRPNREFPTDEDIPEDVTLDVRYSPYKRIVTIRSLVYCSGYYNALNESVKYYLAPIKIIGDYEAIAWFNYDTLINENHPWDDELRNYTEEKYGLKACNDFYFMVGAYIEPYKMCPYTVNLDLYKILYFMSKQSVKAVDIPYTSFNYEEALWGNYIGITFYPYLTSLSFNSPISSGDNFKKGSLLYYSPIKNSFCNTNGKTFVNLIRGKLKSELVRINTYDIGESACVFLFGEQSEIKCRTLYILANTIVNNPTIPKVHFYVFDDDYNTGLGYVNLPSELIHPTNYTYINIMDLNTTDKNLITKALRKGTNSFHSFISNRKVPMHHPAIFYRTNNNNNGTMEGVFGSGWNGLSYYMFKMFDDSTPLILIVDCSLNFNFNFSSVATAEGKTPEQYVIENFRKYILYNLLPLTTASSRHITFYTALLNLLTQEERNYIVNTLNYRIIEV